MRSGKQQGRRSRSIARGSIAVVAASAFAVMAGSIWSACGGTDQDLCAANAWLSTAAPGRLDLCCPSGIDPQGPTMAECCSSCSDCNVPLAMRCPRDGGSDDGAEGGPIPAADGGSDAGDAMADGPIEPPCPGQCLPWLPDPWSPPQLLWIGPEGAAPPCPAPAIFMAYAGGIDLDAGALPCGQCGCAAPDGGCVLPTTLTANSTACPGTDPSTIQTPFDAPPGWDGGCFAGDRIDAGALCDGRPCVASLTIAAPTVAETGCTAIQPPTPDAGLTASYGVACIGQAAGVCAGGSYCAPPPATGFEVCVAQQGDDDCPGSPYTEKHLAFIGHDDTRKCSPCTCSAPSGSTCTVTLSIYPDNACAAGVTLQVAIESTEPLCDGVHLGAGVGSESASPPIYAPGSCEPAGGVAGGSVTPTTPTTFCCIPAASGPPTP